MLCAFFLVCQQFLFQPLVFLCIPSPSARPCNGTGKDLPALLLASALTLFLPALLLLLLLTGLAFLLFT